MPTEVATRLDGDRIVARQAGEGEEAVLCVHGLSSSSASLATLVEVLADRGFTALAPDLRGHGASQGPRGRISQARAVRDLETWADVLAERGINVAAIVGHSLGGFWAMAAHETLDVDAIALVATPASIRSQLTIVEELGYRLGGLAHRLVSPLGLEPRVTNDIGLDDVLDDEDDRERARQADLLQETIPLANAGDLLDLDGPAMAADLTVPAILAYAERDRLVPEASTRELYEAAPEPRTWLELPGPHECFFASGGSRAGQRLAEALAEHV